MVRAIQSWTGPAVTPVSVNGAVAVMDLGHLAVGHVSWDGSIPVDGGTLNATDSSGGVYNGYAVGRTSTMTYRNHGAYVAAIGGGSVGANSCIGMPVEAHP